MAGDSAEEEVMRRAFAKIEQTDAREAEAQQQAAAVEAAAALLAEARQRIAESGELWTLGDDVAVAGLVDTVVKADPVNAVRWLVLANLAGTATVNKALDGGVLGVGGLARLESAVNAELERRTSTARWLKDGGTVTLADMASKEPRVPLWKYKDQAGNLHTAIPGGIVGLVVAPGSTGKTSWLVELVMRTAAGQSFDALGWSLGTYRDRHGRPVTPKFSVMAVLAEEDETGRNDGCRRVWADETREANKKAFNDAFPRMRIWYGAGHDTALGEQVQLDDPIRGRVTTVQGSAFHAELCDYARKTGPALIVLDPINQLLPQGMSENDATSAAAIIRLANELRNAAEDGMKANLPDDEKANAAAYPRPVVLLAHHENKGAGAAGVDKVRGSTAFVDNARLVIQMRRLTVGKGPTATHYTVWEATKSNYTAKWDAVAESVRNDHGIVWDPTEETLQAIEEAAAVEAAKEKGRHEGLLHAAQGEGKKGTKKAEPNQAPAPASPAVPIVRLPIPADDEGDPWAE